jgi:hypothetical protein
MRPTYERQLVALESSYRDQLLLALQRCAEGRWDLFAQNELAHRHLGKAVRSRLNDPNVGDLLALGSEIEQHRRKLGLEPFSLHERLLLMRSSHGPNTPGEPKLAQQWLDELRAL